VRPIIVFTIGCFPLSSYLPNWNLKSLTRNLPSLSRLLSRFNYTVVWFTDRDGIPKAVHLIHRFAPKETIIKFLINFPIADRVVPHLTPPPFSEVRIFPEQITQTKVNTLSVGVEIAVATRSGAAGRSRFSCWSRLEAWPRKQKEWTKRSGAHFD